MGDYVTPTGLQIPTVESLLEELALEQRSTIDAELNTAADSLVGQLNAIFASHLRKAYEALQIAWNGNDPDACEGALLENLCAITSTIRAAATHSRFVGTRKVKLTLNAATTIPINTQFSTPGNLVQLWRTTEEITSTTAGDYLVSVECVETGPIACNAGTLTVIATPALGLNAVTNDFDAILGTETDNDDQLWLRRENELRATGTGTVDAIRADVLSIELENGLKPIQTCHVLENDTDVTNGDGLPPHSIEVLVFDGLSLNCPNNTLAQRIWDSGGAGIETIGNTSGIAIDSRGISHIVKFSRPALLEVLIEATLTLTNAGELPSQYLSAVQTAIIAQFAAKVRAGSVIRANHYEAACIAIPGIDDASIRMSFDPNPLGSPGANLTLAVREIGFVQSSGITAV